MPKKKQKLVLIDGHFYPVKEKAKVKVDNKVGKKKAVKNSEKKIPPKKDDESEVNKPYYEKLFELYKIWRSLPPGYKGMDQSRLKVLGFDDNGFINDLLSIRNQSQFVAKFELGQNTLTAWNKKIDDEGLGDTWKIWAKKLTSNIMSAYGRRLISKGNGQDVLVWNKLVEDFREKSEVKNDINISLKEILDQLDK